MSDQRFFHFLIEGRQTLQFFWNVVFSGASVADARSHVVRFLEAEGVELVGFDEEETGEVDLSALPPAWLEAARPDRHLAAAGGRIWVDPSTEPDADPDA